MITRSKSSSFLNGLSKGLATIMSFGVLALSIAMMIVVNHNADFAEINYSTKLASGPIIMSVEAFIMTFLPGVKKYELE